MNLMFDMVDEAMCKPSTINQLKKNQKGKYGFVHVHIHLFLSSILAVKIR